MAFVSSLLHYSAPLTPTGPPDGWVIDALTRPPEIVQNFRNVAVEVPIADLRDEAIQPGLDTAGFERVEYPAGINDKRLAESDPAALEGYRQQTAALLTSLTGANSVVFFDTTLRQEDTDVVNDESTQSAHLRVHVDQSPRSALARATRNGESAESFRRFQIVNVWRPLIAPVRNFPLALCDYRTVDPSTDLVATRLNFPSWLKDRESYSVKYNPNHRWSYWAALSPDEAIVFKCYDSASSGLDHPAEAPVGTEPVDVSGLCPHSAFFDVDGPRTGRLRTSLELRALLFFR